MRYLFCYIFLLPWALQAQLGVNNVADKTHNTFTNPHVNTWLVVNKYLDYNDSIYFTEAVHSTSSYQNWEEISFTVQNQGKILIADFTEKTVFILINEKETRHKKTKPILLDDSLSFLFSDDVLDTMFQTDSGYVIRGMNGYKNVVIDSVNFLIKRFENRYYSHSNENSDLLSTEWILVTHSTNAENAKKITEFSNYINEKDGRTNPIGVLLNFEIMDLNEE